MAVEECVAILFLGVFGTVVLIVLGNLIDPSSDIYIVAADHKLILLSFQVDVLSGVEYKDINSSFLISFCLDCVIPANLYGKI